MRSMVEGARGIEPKRPSPALRAAAARAVSVFEVVRSHLG